jgi:alpha-glucoside transport system permease protein
MSRFRADLLVIDDVGPPRRSRARRPSGRAWLWLLPTPALIGVIVAWPAVTTLHTSVLDPEGRFAAAANYTRALRDPQLWITLRNTAVWAVVVPVLVAVLGYGLAVLTRRVRVLWLRTLMLAPVALPLIVTAVAFRLLYAPSSQLGPATALLHALGRLVGVDPAAMPSLLGPGLIVVSLVTAFVWTWVGLAVVMFRAALDAIPAQIEDAARAEGADPLRVLVDVRWPFLRRVAGILVLLTAAAASRTFDLVLVMAPGSVQHRAEVLSLYVLRQSAVQQPGEAAAVSVLWLLVVVAGALLTVRWTRHEWPWPSGGDRLRVDEPAWPRRLGRARPAARLIRLAVLGAALLVFVFPLVLLLMTALHRPDDPAVRGWLAPLSVGSLAQLPGTELLASLLPTAALAAGVAVCVVVLGALAAYAMSWFDLPGTAVLAVALLAAAVVPVQAIAAPLHQVLSPMRPYGTMLPLGVVHVGLGLPLAVLVLRNAFSSVPVDRVRAARLRSTDIVVLLRVIVPGAWRALVAVAALEFVLVWNDFVVAFLFGGPGFSPVGMVLFGQSRQFVTNAGVLAAGAVVASLLPLLVVLGAQRSIITGLVSGAGRR